MSRMEVTVRFGVDVSNHRYQPTRQEVVEALRRNLGALDYGEEIVIEPNPHDRRDWRRYDPDEWRGFAFTTELLP